MFLLLIFSLLLLFSVFEICDTKEYNRNHEQEKISKILQNYLQPIKQLTDNLPNHEVEIQLEFSSPDDEKYPSQSPGKDYIKNIYPKHKGKSSYVVLQKPGHEKQQIYGPYYSPEHQKLYDLSRNEPHKLSYHIEDSKLEHKTHLPIQGYPRSEYQKQIPHFEFPRLEISKALPLASSNQRFPVLPPGPENPRPDYHRPQNIEYPRQNIEFLQNNEYPRSNYQTQSDLTNNFEFHTPEHQKHLMHMEYQKHEHPKRLDLVFQRQDRNYHQYAPVQPYFEFRSHDHHTYPSLSPQRQVVYVPYNDHRFMRRSNDETKVKSDGKSTSTTIASTVTTTTPSSTSTSANSVSSKSPVYVEDLREILNEFIDKLQSTKEIPQPSVIMPNPGSHNGNLEDIVHLIKQGLQVAKRLQVPNADQLDWLQIKLPKNANQLQS